MSELTQDLFNLGRAHAASACLLHRAAVEHATTTGHDDPETFAFNGEQSVSVNLLLCLGVELLLKAALTVYNPVIDSKYLSKEIGHSLKTAYQKSCESGFNSDAPHLESFVDIMEKPYTAHWFRYEIPTEMPLPGDFGEIVNMLERLAAEVCALLPNQPQVD